MCNFWFERKKVGEQKIIAANQLHAEHRFSGTCNTYFLSTITNNAFGLRYHC